MIHMHGNVKMGIMSIRRTKMRSLLTMFGVIIGVTSVITITSIGNGVKNQLVKQIDKLGNNVVSVRSGRVQQPSLSTNIQDLRNQISGGNSTLTDRDYKVIQLVGDVLEVAPIAVTAGTVKYEDRAIDYSQIIATNKSFASILGLSTSAGTFLNDKPAGISPTVVVGATIAEKFLQDISPIGSTLTIRGKDFLIRGVLKPSDSGPFSMGINYDDAVIVEYETGKQLSETLQLNEMLIKVDPSKSIDGTVKKIYTGILTSHNNQEDFSVLKQEELLKMTNDTFKLLTVFVSVIAIASLMIGGIGIMNIMLVSVSERTHEIGIRKAVGATNNQILGQFFVEAVTLSITGALLGVLMGIVISIVITVTTNLQPALSLPFTLASIAAAILVGSIFGVAPAVQAAKKDPIESLRHMQ